MRDDVGVDQGSTQVPEAIGDGALAAADAAGQADPEDSGFDRGLPVAIARRRIYPNPYSAFSGSLKNNVNAPAPAR
jgi:hypothetical protein